MCGLHEIKDTHANIKGISIAVFNCHVIRCAIARRGVRHDAAKAGDIGGVQRVL